VTDDAGTWVIVALQLIGAAGFAGFWLTWFRVPHDQEWLPEGYHEHEAPFVWSDSMVIGLLIASALLLVFEQPLGESLALVAGGALLFLGVLDTAYFARTGLFARDREGLWNAAIVIGVLALGIVLVARFA
jgi:hypothetical protein